LYNFYKFKAIEEGIAIYEKLLIRLLFFFFEKSHPKLKVFLGYFLSSGQNIRFGEIFVVRTVTVILEDFF
jgi:hypothetical protein